MILDHERKPLRQKIRALWEERLNTADMVKVLQLPEHEVERELHAVLEVRRAVIESVGK